MSDVAFADLANTNLEVNSILKAGNPPDAGGDPIAKALPGTRNMGGFRTVGPAYMVLTSNMADSLWPDNLDYRRGALTYFGDNKSPGKDIHDTTLGGNSGLMKMFDALYLGNRQQIPPVLAFGPGPQPRDFKFLGLFAPGPDQDLIAERRTSNGARFLNYKAVFSILDCDVVTRAWLSDLQAGNPLGESCPPVWRRFVANGVYQCTKRLV